MSFWLGIHAYSFKHTILSAVLADSTNLELAKNMAAHISISSTRRYTKAIQVGDALKAVSKVVIPGLHPRFGNYSTPDVK